MVEARKFANEKKMQPVIEQQSSTKKVGANQEKKGKKKSWKTALFSFWRSSSSEKKAKQQPNEKSCPKRRGHVSGPVYGVVGAATTIGGGQWQRLAVSGPMSSQFHQKKMKGYEDGIGIAYVSLERLNQPEYDSKTYGPVYLVS